MEHIVEKIMEFREEIYNKEKAAEVYEVSREEFTFLLGGISSFRMVPGISEHMGFEELYHCKTDEEAAQVKEHLNALWGIVDKDSLLEACYTKYDSSEQYEQFMTFWKGAPLFDLSELGPEGLQGFTMCMQLATHFHPMLQEKGFYAWDINERIGLCRTAVAAGIITEEEFWEITDNWVKQAQVFYHSYEEYAVSCLCGAMYQMKLMGEDDLESFLDLNIRIINILLDDGPWKFNAWFVPEKREWADLVENWGCLITYKALENNRIGYMYREEPSEEHPDCGWRFMFGDESQEYMDNSDNITIIGMNAICNLFPEVMAFIHANPGAEYEQDEDGDWSMC